MVQDPESHWAVRSLTNWLRVPPLVRVLSVMGVVTFVLGSLMMAIHPIRPRILAAPVGCPVGGSNVPGAADPWGGCFPGPGNTGVPAGTSLTAYGGPTDIYDDDVTIDGKIVDGLLRVGGNNFTIKNSIIYGGITTIDDPEFPNPTFTVQDVTIDSRTLDPGFKSIVGDNITVIRSDVSGSNSGGSCSSCTIEDSYFHALWVPSDSLLHMSGYRMGQFTTLSHNTLSCDFDPTGLDPEAGCSADLTGYGDYAPVTDNVIDKNLFISNPDSLAYYCAYGGSSTGKPYSGDAARITFSNNIFQRGTPGTCGIAMPVGDYDNTRPGHVWTNNKYDDGTVIPQP